MLQSASLRRFTTLVATAATSARVAAAVGQSHKRQPSFPRRADRPTPPPPSAPYLTGFPFPPILIGKRGRRGRPRVRVSPRADARCRCYTESRLCLRNLPEKLSSEAEMKTSLRGVR